jgi:hypothetical protein
MSLVLAYKNFAANRNISHIGLGVAAINTAKVLRRAGLRAHVWPILSAGDLWEHLEGPRGCGVEDVIISAPWLPSSELSRIALAFPETKFCVNCHSNVGFLQADRNGVKLIRELLDLERGAHNIRAAGNSERFCAWVRSTFAAPCLYLPNLYYVDREHMPRPRQQPYQPGQALRIGVFGATRPLKNLMSAAAAALDVARGFHAPLELWLSAGRAEGGGETVLAALQEMLAGLPGVTLHLSGWETWPAFRRTVGHMHLLLQPSYTESFNMVTADGVAEGLASVVSDAIDWAPADWKAEVDDTLAIARTARRLLLDHHAAAEGLRALERHVEDGIRHYRHFVERRP